MKNDKNYWRHPDEQNQLKLLTTILLLWLLIIASVALAVML